MVKTMLKASALLVSFFLWSHAYAQTVSNVSATQQGQEIVVSYSLQTEEACEVFLYISTDSGRSWQGPLTNCTGDVGKGITAGAHEIVWDVLKDREQLTGKGFQFKVVLRGREQIEVFTASRKSFEPEMVFVDGSTFLMGSKNYEKDEKPIHQVELSSYFIGKYEVTQAQWKAIMGNNPSYFKDCDQCPVEQVSWLDVQEYIRKLNQKTGKKYRLPTEAEWEFAARGGIKSKGYIYSGSNDINTVAWYSSNSDAKSHVVGGKQGNELGIHDMSGNVWEWCSDWFGEYSFSYQRNPQGATNGQDRVLRGGSWFYEAALSRVTDRGKRSSDNNGSHNGFRLVLSPAQ